MEACSELSYGRDIVEGAGSVNQIQTSATRYTFTERPLAVYS